MRALRAGTEPQIMATLISMPDHIAMSTPVTICSGDVSDYSPFEVEK